MIDSLISVSLPENRSGCFISQRNFETVTSGNNMYKPLQSTFPLV